MITFYFKLNRIMVYEKNISYFQEKKCKTQIINITLYYIGVEVIADDTTV